MGGGPTGEGYVPGGGPEGGWKPGLGIWNGLVDGGGCWPGKPPVFGNPVGGGPCGGAYDGAYPEWYGGVFVGGGPNPPGDGKEGASP